MTVLSADALGGRKPGTPDERKTLAWLQHAFASAGLAPGIGRSWLQPVKLVRQVAVRGTLVVRTAGQSLDLSQDVVLLGDSSSIRINDAPVIYAGHAARIAPLPKGALVLFRNTDLPGETGPAADTLVRRANLAGAGAVLEILEDAEFDSGRWRKEDLMDLQSSTRPRIRGFIRASAARRLLQTSGKDLAALDAEAASATFAPATLRARADMTAVTKVRRFTSYNVVGRLRGTVEPDKAIAFIAHWDGFGTCRKEGTDRICNGAVDNASGIAAILEVARLFKAGTPPERSILIVATTGEEQGLLGSRAYVQAPAVPLANTVAAFNLDTVAIYGRDVPAGFAGSNLTTADPLFEQVARDQNRVLDKGACVQSFLKRSDAWSFLRSGVPVYMLYGAISCAGPDKGKRFMDYVTTRYHRPADEMYPDLPVDGAAQDAELAHAVGLALAKASAQVDFLPSVPFKRPGLQARR